jgi:AhpD family alkylhydroperoxidase
MARLNAVDKATTTGKTKELAGGALSPKLREQIALAVGEANGCQYCVSAHTAIGKRLGTEIDFPKIPLGTARR